MLLDRALSSTTFAAGPDEALITDDVYQKKDDGLVNGFPPIDLPKLDLTASDKIIADDLRGGIAKSLLPANSSLLEKGTKFLKDGFNALGGLPGVAKIASKVAGPSIASRLGSGGALTGIPGLSGSAASNLNSILRQIPGLNNTLNGSVNNNIGTFVAGSNSDLQRITPGNVNNALATTSLINTLTGKTNAVVDKDVTTKLISAVAGMGIQSGLSNSFSSISPLAGNDKTILFKAAAETIKHVSKSGNLSALGDVLDTVGPGRSQGLVTRDSLSKLSTNYTPTVTYPAGNLQGEFAYMKELYGVSDPSWSSKTRVVSVPNSTQGATRTDQVIDITTMQYGNVDFKKMVSVGSMNSNDPNDKYLNLANAFPPVTPENVLKKSFPLTMTSVTTQTVKDETKTPFNGMTENEYLKTYTKLDGKTQAERDAEFEYLKANSTIR
jgi:hypothetical protein